MSDMTREYIGGYGFDGEPELTCEEVVRCRDCAGFTETWDGWECERFSGEYHRAEPDGFCSWGIARKENGDDR